MTGDDTIVGASPNEARVFNERGRTELGFANPKLVKVRARQQRRSSCRRWLPTLEVEI
ncbi:unnamed protein product [Lactuca saligna]|uniref:Uncharacterized protein n=1 Tax=Lactuca saligna TaxID=75948 RepID=A0AA35ZH09_LACSI|nr:unnamed protein product [Lactuca saligna]